MLPDERLVFVDIETTGLELDAEIIQIAAIATDSLANELETFEVKIQTELRQGDRAHSRFNDRKWRKLAYPPRGAAIRFKQFLTRHATIDIIGNKGALFRVAQLVAHNSEFDGPRLRAWFDRLDLFFPSSYRVLCTMQRAMWLFDENKMLSPPKNYKLQTLCQYFDVQLTDDQAHDAWHDVRATAELYRAMTRSPQSHVARGCEETADQQLA